MKFYNNINLNKNSLPLWHRVYKYLVKFYLFPTEFKGAKIFVEKSQYHFILSVHSNTVTYVVFSSCVVNS